MSKFKVGETFIYQNGDSFEIGVVGKVTDNENYFCYYHMGETMALTNLFNMRKIKNSYAYDIIRKVID